MMNKIIHNIKSYLKMCILMLSGLALFDSKIESSYLILEIITYFIIKLMGIFIILYALNYLPFLKKPLFKFNITYKNTKEDK